LHAADSVAALHAEIASSSLTVSSVSPMAAARVAIRAGRERAA
jgi:hypothetical protein